MKIALALLLVAVLVLGSPGHTHAQSGDPLKSDACAAALAQLDAARIAAAPQGTVQDLRSAAAGACLGSTAMPARPSRVLQAPVVVPPPQIEVPAAAQPLPAAALPPPVTIQRPAVPAVCDAGGCWTNDGTHLRALPPGLVGPGGLCIPQGGLVYCPWHR